MVNSLRNNSGFRKKQNTEVSTDLWVCNGINSSQEIKSGYSSQECKSDRVPAFIYDVVLFVCLFLFFCCCFGFFLVVFFFGCCFGFISAVNINNVKNQHERNEKIRYKNIFPVACTFGWIWRMLAIYMSAKSDLVCKYKIKIHTFVKLLWINVWFW